MEAETKTDLRNAVVEHFVERCDDAGLVRNRTTTVAQHAQFMQRMAEHLSYMAKENLMTLAELTIEVAAAQGGREWPKEVTIRALANNVQVMPIQQHRIVTSWLASVEGPQALAGGFEVELYWHLDQMRRPPNSYAMKQIRERAATNHRRVELISDRIARGKANSDDQSWLEAYLRQRVIVRKIISDGKKSRGQSV